MPQQLQMYCHVKPWKCVFEKMKWHQAVKCVKNAGMKKANMAERAGSPVKPGNDIILAVGIIIAKLCITKFISRIKHGRSPAAH